MIDSLASPLVCVIDDEVDDYRTLLDALAKAGVAACHYRGETDTLPSAPLRDLRLVFTDIHLSDFTGRNAVSHAAKVFLTIVGVPSTPIVAVVWSKFAEERDEHDGETTLADALKAEILQNQPELTDRVVFVDIPKPPPSARPNPWLPELGKQIETAVAGLAGLRALWALESQLRVSAYAATGEITDLAARQRSDSGGSLSLDEALKASLRGLVNAHAGKAADSTEAPIHVTNATAQLVVDRVGYSKPSAQLGEHAAWLADPVSSEFREKYGPEFNRLLLTTPLPTNAAAIPPGSVLRVTDESAFESVFRCSVADLRSGCRSDVKAEWATKSVPIVVELSPDCDFAQGKLTASIFVAGVVGPASLMERGKARTDAWHLLSAKFAIDWPAGGASRSAAWLLVGGRHRTTFKASVCPDWCEPWFRLRELPTSALRNWFSAFSSRVGFPAV